MKKSNKFLSNKFFANKLILFFLIPLLCIFIWLVCALLFNNWISFSVTVVGNNEGVLKETTTSKLFKDKKVSGEFVARDNYLGIVMLRFEDFVKPDFRGEDVLSFKLREKGSSEWYYVNNYRSGTLEDELLFPFGFPVITYSKGKTYEFELKSLFGNSRNAVQLSKDKPVLMTAYQFPKKEIAGSKKRIVSYVLKKTANSFTNIDFILSSIVFAVPLIFYLLWLSFYLKSISIKPLLPYFGFILICLDIFIIKASYLGIFVILMSLWLLYLHVHKAKSMVSIYFSFILVIIWLFLNYSNHSSFTTKLNIWTYFFLVCGIFQLILEEKKQQIARKE